jgi:2-polyprenyl-3-methyl-5-hydroxy-6-metoxy-1,4-benzoquinol methylase
MTTCAQTWAADLQSWAIPQEILDQAPQSPWGFPVSRFAQRAEQAVVAPRGWSFERAFSLLPEHGSVLDVGVGAGAGSLPLAGRAQLITGVDPSAAMLDAFRLRAASLGVDAVTVEGRWPDVARAVGVHDVAVAHHLVYDVADVVPLLAALTDHAREAVVLELPPRHPLTWMNPLWHHFWNLERPVAPNADDLIAILRELGVRNLVAYRWSRDDVDLTPLDERAALVARRLCLPEERIPEVRSLIVDLAPAQQRDVVTIAWRGTGSASGSRPAADIG